MVKLLQIRPNLCKVTVGRIEIYFSYETPIAFIYDGDLTIRENDWGPTTGKHLNYIDPDKSKRRCANVFNRLLGEAYGE